MPKLNLQRISVLSQKPFLIAGPCSAETEDQILQTAIALSDVGISALRAGIWKPRTRPDSFEGVGEPGLYWLKSAGNAISVPVMVEVANARHVEQALKAEIDILWIGARTTVNPFSVQEIADALKGCRLPVLVKNPVNPDLELWIGAFERLEKAGITELAAVHRGFSSFAKTNYRNQPNWEIPIELQRRIPNLPLICDPSHIAGKPELLRPVSQRALDLNYDGLMIESHICPAKAWSDAHQQITPKQLAELWNSLTLRKPESDNSVFYEQIEQLRKKIDELDSQLLGIISERMRIARLIGYFKKQNHVTILQSKRYDEVLTTRLASALALELTPEFVKKLFENLHQEAIQHQDFVMNLAEFVFLRDEFLES
ncbi:MAG: bifunctional 3-deoxy-7-phosphoheptulonate synthase/chorismate mutase type II [Bacteroidia bacterium]|nr:bifunctional 3-deoxy-7-phosphoheptulonate synthase/chorismate mutase type II [Bacteroidia bacterium]